MYSWRQQQGHVLGLQCTDEEETDALWEAGIAFFAAVLERGTTEGGTSIQPTKRQQRSRQTIIQSPEQVQCAQDQPSVCINKHHPAIHRIGLRLPEKPARPLLPLPSDPRPQALKPLQRRRRGHRTHIRMQFFKKQPLYIRIEGRAAGIWCWAVRRGWARGGVDHIQSS